MDNLIIQYLLKNKAYFRQVYPYLKKNHFEKIEHQEIFSNIQNYYNKYKEIPSIREVATELKTQKESDLRNNIIRVFKSIITSKDEIKEEYLKDKTEEHIRNKEFMDFLISSAESIQAGDIDLAKALNDVQEINKISLQENIGVDYTDIEPRIEYYKTRLKGIKTGLESLDRVLGGGFRPKTLNIISAKSGGGKCSRGSEKIIVHSSDEMIEKIKVFIKNKNKVKKIPIVVTNSNVEYVNNQRLSFAKLINEFINILKYTNNDSLTDKEKDNAIKNFIKTEDKFRQCYRDN